jgi:structural maintenance of chromosome 2
LNKERLSVVLEDLERLADKSLKYDRLTRKLSLAETELEGIQKHLSQTSYGILEEKHETMSKELEESNEEYATMQQEQAAKWKLYHELKDREVELTQQREDRLGQIEEKIKEAKAAATEASEKAREAEARKETLIMELDSLKADLASAEEGVAAAEAALFAATEDESSKEIAVGDVKALWDEAKSALQNFEEKLTQFSSELAEIKREKANLAKNVEKCNLEAKKLSVNISRMRKDKQNAEKLVSSLLKTHPWIESEKPAFGVEGGDYDFEATNPDEMSRQLQSLRGEQETLVSAQRFHDI